MKKAHSPIDSLVTETVFGADSPARENSRRRIRDTAHEQGIYVASIHGLYEAAGKSLFSGMTIPAINIRGITYDVARAVFRAARKGEVGAFIFEIARSEIGYTGQRPAEYETCVLAAAVKEGFQGPVFLQGDHFQVKADRYGSDPEKELEAIRELIRESVDAGFLNIDIDASTLVDLKKTALEEQQELNCHVTAALTDYIRRIEPQGIPIAIGGEIGEVGGRNSTMEDLNAFMSGYLKRLGSNIKGISKISVQTGTSHGGVVLPDGSIAKVQIDFHTLEQISKVVRKEYGMGGAVQHGASTLPDEAFDKFPQVGTLEVHLATGFQNMIYDSPYFPKELLKDIYSHILKKYAGERKPGETEEQFLYKTRKKAFGDFKREMWSLPEENLQGLRQVLEERFSLLFRKLNVVHSRELVLKYA
ncbi:MAG: class II fructose-bisphosphate aldolase [Candidatus Aminicenantales bacterium]